jgi:nicotinamidase-related amidase
MARQNGTHDRSGDAVRLRPRITSKGDEVYSNDASLIAIDTTYERMTAQNTAVLLIDHQIGPLWELEFAPTRRAVVSLAALARELNLPTVITAIGVETWGAVIPELSDAFPEAPHIVRGAVNAWEDPTIQGAIRETGRKKLLIAGGAAELGVAFCALSAAREGYQVYVAIEASAQLSHAAISRLARAGVIVTTTSLVAAEMIRRRRRVLAAGGRLDVEVG